MAQLAQNVSVATKGVKMTKESSKSQVQVGLTKGFTIGKLNVQNAVAPTVTSSTKILKASSEKMQNAWMCVGCDWRTTKINSCGCQMTCANKRVIVCTKCWNGVSILKFWIDKLGLVGDIKDMELGNLATYYRTNVVHIDSKVEKPDCQTKTFTKEIKVTAEAEEDVEEDEDENEEVTVQKFMTGTNPKTSTKSQSNNKNVVVTSSCTKFVTAPVVATKVLAAPAASVVVKVTAPAASVATKTIAAPAVSMVTKGVVAPAGVSLKQ